MSKIWLLLIILLAIIFLAGAAYLNSRNNSTINQQVATPTPTPTSSPSPTATPQSQVDTQPSKIPADWLTYKNSTYGFEISYPKTYKALDDKNNLYGWPNAVVLLYKGGQSYDVVVEVWGSEAEYKAKYPKDTLTVKKIGNKFLTVFDITKSGDNAQIISTFN